MENFPRKIAPATLTLAQTLTQIQATGRVGEGGGESSVEQFQGGQFSDHDGNFTGGNLNSAFQTKINATSSVE